MKMSLSTVLRSTVWFAAVFYASTSFSTVEDDALAYLNTLRANAGMIVLTPNATLDTAAEAHSNYLEIHNFAGHYEDIARSGWTGDWAADRAVAAGYASRSILENVATGQDSAKESVDGLMTAVYHRFGFLDEEIDTIGIGLVLDVENPATGYYSTYNMANTGVTTMCEGPVPSGPGSYVGGVCADASEFYFADVFNAALAAVGLLNPRLIVWPQNGAVDIPPAFFEESPDPLPDYSVSGNPISLQFNSHRVAVGGLTSIALFNDQTGVQLDPARTRLLDEATDPNAKFSALQYALYPLDRLEWNTRYRVEAAIVTDGAPSNLNWTFTTRDLGVPTFTVAGSGQVVEAESGQEIAIYVVPQVDQQASLGAIGWSYSDGNFPPQLTYVDGNTVKVIYSDPVVGNTAVFTAGIYTFSVRIKAATAAAADLALSKIVDNATPMLGDDVTFTLTISNNGPDDATGVAVTDLLAAPIDYVSDNGGGAYNAGTGVWTVGALANGANKVLTITATTTSNTAVIDNAAISASDQPDPVAANNTASVSVDAQEADLALTKMVDNAAPAVGANVTFTLTVTNNGPDAATGVSVTDLLPAGFTYDSDNGGGSYNDTTGIWTVGALANGANSVLTITVSADSADAVTNNAAIGASDQPDPNLTDNSAAAIVDAVTAGQSPDGDLNNDENVTVADALIALRYALGLITPVTQDVLNHGDVAPLGAPDESMTVADALVILRVALGLVTL